MDGLLNGIVFLIYSFFFWATMAAGVAMVAIVFLGLWNTVKGFFARAPER